MIRDECYGSRGEIRRSVSPYLWTSPRRPSFAVFFDFTTALLIANSHTSSSPELTNAHFSLRDGLGSSHMDPSLDLRWTSWRTWSSCFDCCKPASASFCSLGAAWSSCCSRASWSEELLLLLLPQRYSLTRKAAKNHHEHHHHHHHQTAGAAARLVDHSSGSYLAAAAAATGKWEKKPAPPSPAVAVAATALLGPGGRGPEAPLVVVVADRCGGRIIQVTTFRRGRLSTIVQSKIEY